MCCGVSHRGLGRFIRSVLCLDCVRVANRWEKWAKRTLAGIAALLLLNALSFGPACWLSSHLGTGSDFVSAAFQPLLKASSMRRSWLAGRFFSMRACLPRKIGHFSFSRWSRSAARTAARSVGAWTRSLGAAAGTIETDDIQATEMETQRAPSTWSDSLPASVLFVSFVTFVDMSTKDTKDAKKMFANPSDNGV